MDLSDRCRTRIQLRTILPSTELLRTFDEVSQVEKVQPGLLNEIIESGVIAVDQGHCVFRHEMLQHFFESEAICGKFKAFPELERSLRNPVNHHLLEFAIDRQSEPSHVRTLLSLGCDANGPSILTLAFHGGLGEAAEQIVRQDAVRLLRDAESDLDNIDIKIELVERSEGRKTLDSRVSDARDWSCYEFGLMNLIAEQLSGGWLVINVLRLVSKTESRIDELLTERYGRKLVSRASV